MATTCTSTESKFNTTGLKNAQQVYIYVVECVCIEVNIVTRKLTLRYQQNYLMSFSRQRNKLYTRLRQNRSLYKSYNLKCVSWKLPSMSSRHCSNPKKPLRSLERVNKKGKIWIWKREWLWMLLLLLFCFPLKSASYCNVI